MNQQIREQIESYAVSVLEWLDMDAKNHGVARSPLVDLFMDTLNALEQNKEQED